MTAQASSRASRLRLPFALVALLLLGGLGVALLTPHPQVDGYLDPANNSLTGSHALADMLGERGFTVHSVYTPKDAVAAVRSARGSGRTAAVTLVVTSPGLLTAGQRRTLAGAGADLLLVAPGQAAVTVMAPGVGVQTSQPAGYGRRVEPRCQLPSATFAGSADVAGYTYVIPARAAGCYPVGGYPSLVRYAAAGHTITILASGAPLSNEFIALDGNAALALNLLSDHRTIVWLTPEPASAVAVPVPGRGPGRSSPSLLPAGVSLLLLQLLVAVALAALWRARRVGPLIAERLPVVVRASETVEGHARLYQARRARSRAAAALRQAMLGRVLPALGLLRDAPQEAVTDAIGRRSGLGRPRIDELVYGQPPVTDADLVRLARNLDDLEREVRSQ